MDKQKQIEDAMTLELAEMVRRWPTLTLQRQQALGLWLLRNVGDLSRHIGGLFGPPQPQAGAIWYKWHSQMWSQWEHLWYNGRPRPKPRPRPRPRPRPKLTAAGLRTMGIGDIRSGEL